MTSLKIAHILSQTAWFGLQLVGKTPEGIAQVKQAWGRRMLELLEIELTVKGTPPPPHSHILVGNHIGFLDIPVIMAVCPNAVFIAKDDLKKWPVIGPCATGGGTIFVNRQSGANRSNARDQIVERLKKNSNCYVTVFPAGTTRLDESKPWKKGIFEIAESEGIPVQLFKIGYSPLRPCAYVEEDHFIQQLNLLFKTKNKKATLTWVERHTSITHAVEFAEKLRAKVVL